MTKDVFISYSRKDKVLVARLVEALSSAGIKTWWDQDLEPGEAWRRILLDRLSTSSGLVVCWSPSAIVSDYVLAEARIALDRALLVPLRFARCTPPPPFSEIQTADLSEWHGEPDAPQFRKLLEAIERNLAERQAYERFEAVQHRISALLAQLDVARIEADAAAGQAAAQSLLGHMLVFGTARKARNVEAGIGWLQKAAEQGVTDAAATLGTAFSLLAVPSNWRAAVHWLEIAAGQGHAEAARELASIFSTGFEGVEKNTVLAEHYHRMSAMLEARKS